MELYTVVLLIIGGCMVLFGIIFCFADIISTATTYTGSRANKEVEYAVRSATNWHKYRYDPYLISPSDKFISIGDGEPKQHLLMISKPTVDTPFAKYLWCKYIIYTSQLNYYKVSGKSELGKYIDKLMEETPRAKPGDFFLPSPGEMDNGHSK